MPKSIASAPMKELLHVMNAIALEHANRAMCSPDEDASPFLRLPTNLAARTLLLRFTPLIPVVEHGTTILPVLSIITKPIPTGPRARLHAPALQSSRKRGGWERGRTKARNHKHNFSKAASVVQCHSLQIVPRPFGLPPNRPKHNFVDDWLVSKPNSTASRASKRRYTGNSSHFNNPNHHRRPVRKNIKHCYHCWATDHLIALCPLREIID
ncbi:hypothetical protein DFH07DRAFT_971819 [Mycena maculata]|uniref:Uncharacterized protein n=1 Tax=Mycena maculata TaxID=230809 RepID=A0AAD7HLB4_9AGAR|nr:hypothetical protein DFH07DRAFT_971819 [Mycena maculata]